MTKRKMEELATIATTSPGGMARIVDNEQCNPGPETPPPLWIIVDTMKEEVSIYSGEEPYLRKGRWSGLEEATIDLDVFMALCPHIQLPEPWEDPEPIPLEISGRPHLPAGMVKP